MKKITLYSLLPVMMIIVFVAAQSPSKTLTPVPDDIDYGWPEEGEEVKAKKMPPGKYAEKYPDKVLTEKEIGVITNWANAEADKIREE
jgi:hypothetical protein